MAAATAATVPSDIKVLFEMRELFNNGFLNQEEWLQRKVQLIDELTNTVRISCIKTLFYKLLQEWR